MVILTSSPSTATSVDQKGQSVLRGIQDFLCFWLWPHSPTTTSTAFPSTLHNPFSTHAGHALPSLCLYFCLQCLHTSGENCLSNFSSKHPKVIPCQLCLPNRTLPVPPHRYLAQMSSAPVTEQAFAFAQNCELLCVSEPPNNADQAEHRLRPLGNINEHKTVCS